MPERFLLENAPQFDVYRWSDYPEVKRITDVIFDEIKALRQSRGKRIREAIEVKKHLRVVLINLWAAHYLSSNPYRGISKNKTDYQRESRYRQIFLTYDYLIPVIDNLRDIGYLEEIIGFQNPRSGIGFRTRIKATDRLIEKILSPEYGVDALVNSRGMVAIVQSSGDGETIHMKDSDGNLVEYSDDENIISMRSSLALINTKLASARITLDITDEQIEALRQRLNGSQEIDRMPIDFTNVKLHRVFNNGSWQQGGRFYGGWWQNIPKEFRKYIDIDHKPTVELDYSGHHIRILYATEGIDPPDDPYDLTEFDREDQKQVVLTMLNAFDKEAALRSLSSEGITNARGLTDALTERHSSIQRHFFTGAGLGLMYQDSILAEKVLLHMLQRGAVVLPVHDSFIVRNSYSSELEEVMVKVFEEQYRGTAKLKIKTTMLEEIQETQEERDEREAQGMMLEPVTSDLEELMASSNSNTWYRNTWGG